MADPRFPDINRIANARSTFSRTERENELQPGRVQALGQQNTLRGLQIGREEAGAASAARVQELNAQDLAGDESAFGKLIRENPVRARQQLEVVAKQRKVDLDAFENGALQIGRFATAVAGLASEPNVSPEQAQADYTRLRESLMKRNPALTDADVPPNISSGFLKKAISFASDIATLQKQAGFGQGQKIITGGTGRAGETQARRVDVAGAEGPVAPPAVAAPKGGGKGKGGGGDEGFQLKAGDANAIRAAANQIYGDLYDPDGNLLITDPTKRVKALRLTARAERIFQRARARGAPMAHNEAVEQAAEELGIVKDDFFQGGTTTRDQRSPTGKSVDRTGTRQQRGSRGSPRQNQLDAFEAFVNKIP